MKEDGELLMIDADQFRRLWLMVEDLETLLWRIKEQSDDLGDFGETDD